VPPPSLYRRHRPRTFAQVVGQEHVVRTLRNAVERGRVHHAYLFVGSRGTGKTSMAKILAACLNCDHGPTVEPDGTCPACVAIANATSLDVIEMDAASNNSVDDVRELRERVGYAPVSGKHKVYILDEAHMLSPQAWNAFLKTLEEPPPNTVFVLATTEAAKVLPTVVDRCHRFDFTRPGVEQIAEVLRRVSAAEGIEAPEAALRMIARHATGSFRDALGTLEQLTTYSGGDSTAGGGGRFSLDDVLAVLGLTDAEELFGALDAVSASDVRGVLGAAARMADAGRDAGGTLRDLEAQARDLLVVQALGGELPDELRLTPERDERLVEQSARLGRGELVRVLDLLAAAQEAVRNGSDPRIQLELCLIKAAAPEVDPSTPALLARIEALEGRLAGTRSPSSAAPPPSLAVPSAPVPPPAPAVAPSAPGASPAELWPALVEAVKPENGMLAAVLCEARPVGIEGDELVAAFPADKEFHLRKAQGDDCRRLVLAALRRVAGRPLSVRYELREMAPAAAPAADSDELVRRFVEEFDAEEIE